MHPEPFSPQTQHRKRQTAHHTFGLSKRGGRQSAVHRPLQHRVVQEVYVARRTATAVAQAKTVPLATRWLCQLKRDPGRAICAVLTLAGIRGCGRWIFGGETAPSLNSPNAPPSIKMIRPIAIRTTGKMMCPQRESAWGYDWY
jgi:hypothetical protein